MAALAVRLAAVSLLVVIGSGCASPVSPATTIPPRASPTAQPPTATATGAAGVSPEPSGPPVWALGLEAQLQCDGPPQSTGGELGDIGPDDGVGNTPQDALATFLRPSEWATFPGSGFDEPIGTAHWAHHAYRHDGSIRAVAVTTDLEPWTLGDGSWTVVAIRACDPSEFDPSDGLTFDLTLWLDADGNPARSDVISAIPGPGHCEWESALMLRLGENLYLRDPKGVLEEQAIESFLAEAELPDGATDTGYHTREWWLFTVPEGDAVYVRTSDGSYERWGRSRDPFLGCA